MGDDLIRGSKCERSSVLVYSAQRRPDEGLLEGAQRTATDALYEARDCGLMMDRAGEHAAAAVMTLMMRAALSPTDYARLLADMRLELGFTMECPDCHSTEPKERGPSAYQPAPAECNHLYHVNGGGS